MVVEMARSQILVEFQGSVQFIDLKSIAEYTYSGVTGLAHFTNGFPV